MTSVLALTLVPHSLAAQTPPVETRSPAEVADDPVLRLGHETVDKGIFVATIAQSVRRASGVAEAQALTREAAAVRTQARAALFPRLTLSLSSNQPLARGFSGNINTLVEQSLAQRRSDAALTADQVVSDFGASSSRIRSAAQRLKAAALSADDAASAVALDGIAAWYDVVGYRAAVTLARESVARQMILRGSVEQRIANGYLAQGDLARADSYLAGARARLARYLRALAGAEARFAQRLGSPATMTVGRVVADGAQPETIATAQAEADGTPSIRAADAIAQAAQQEAHAASADRLPNLGVSLSAGRYGVFENSNDYSVSARATLRMRFSAGFNATTRQAEARADAARAHADKLREDAQRDASIAWTDVSSLTDELAAMEDNYRAARQSRDVLAERFRVSRGTLFDLLESEESCTGAAEGYVQTLVELDAARYVLLARTGRLLSAFGIAPTDEGTIQ